MYVISLNSLRRFYFMNGRKTHSFRKFCLENFKGTRLPFERCDLVGAKLDFVHELFQSLCKRSDDNIRLTLAHYAIKIG